MDAAKELSEKYGIEAEVWDARSINPLDYEPLVESVKKTGRVLLSSDACERGSVMQMIAANLTRYAFDYLDAPPAVVGAKLDLSMRRNGIRILPTSKLAHRRRPRTDSATPRPRRHQQPQRPRTLRANR